MEHSLDAIVGTQGPLVEGVGDIMEVGEVIILEVEEAPVTVMVSSAPCLLIPLPLLPAVDLLIYSHYIPHLNHLPSLPDNHHSSLLDNL